MTEWNIDRICELTKTPAVLNALHACRPGHPWNKTAKDPWHAAYFAAAKQSSNAIPSDALDWLWKQRGTAIRA